MNVSQAEKIKELIISAKNLAIVMHVNPDGDALGSALALYQYARQQNITATVVSPTPITEALDWLPYRQEVFIFDEKQQAHKKELQLFDSIIFVDHSSKGRCGSIADYIIIPKTRRAYIDHHPSPDMEVETAISETKSAATCCIVYELLQMLKAHITKQMASCLYTGIVTDTGNFRYGNGIAQVFRIASELILLGIDKEDITQKIYYTNTEQHLRLLGLVLKEKMQQVGSHSAYICITQQDFDKTGTQHNDTEDFVNYPLTIKNVYVSVIFIEKEDHIKISLRSRGEFDVNLLARKHFNGGGHKNAAGGRFYGTMQQAVTLYSKNTI